MKTSTKMKASNKSKSDLLKDLEFLQTLVEERRFAMKYMEYDLECIRRERDFYRKKAEDK